MIVSSSLVAAGRPALTTCRPIFSGIGSRRSGGRRGRPSSPLRSRVAQGCRSAIASRAGLSGRGGGPRLSGRGGGAEAGAAEAGGLKRACHQGCDFQSAESLGSITILLSVQYSDCTEAGEKPKKTALSRRLSNETFP